MEYIPQIYNDFNSGHIIVSHNKPTKKLIFQHTKTFGAKTLKLSALKAFNDANINILSPDYISGVKSNLVGNSREYLFKVFEDTGTTYEFESNEDPITIEITFKQPHFIKRFYLYDYHYLKSSQMVMIDAENKVIKKINLQDVDAESSMEIDVKYKFDTIASHENNYNASLGTFPDAEMHKIDPDSLTLFQNNKLFDPLNSINPATLASSNTPVNPQTYSHIVDTLMSQTVIEPKPEQQPLTNVTELEPSPELIQQTPLNTIMQLLNGTTDNTNMNTVEGFTNHSTWFGLSTTEIIVLVFLAWMLLRR
jgi:hypothetical protein